MRHAYERVIARVAERSAYGRRVAITLALGAMLMPVAAEGQYLDPGAASIVLQAVVAGVVAVGASVKIYWSRISSLFSRRRRHDDKS